MAVSTDRLAGGTASADVASDDRYRALLSLSPAPMALCDSNGVIAMMNLPAATMFGATGEGALAGRDFLDFVSPRSGPEARRLAARLLTGDVETMSARLSFRRIGGQAFDAEVVARRTPRQTGDAVLYALTEIEDGVLPAGMSGTAADAGSPALAEAIESMPEGFALFGPDERLVLFNSKYRTEIWPQLKDFIREGVTFEQIVRETLRRDVWDTNAPDPDSFLREALARHRNVPSVHEMHYPDGRVIQQHKQRTSDGGVIAIYSDITARRRREADISETQDRHRRLLETLPDGVVIHSGGKFAYVNPALIEIYGGKSHTDLIGRNSVDFIPPEDRTAALETLERVLRERTTLEAEEQRRIRLDGQIIYVEVRHTFIQWNGKPAILSVIRDLTERKRAEFALRETERRYLSVASNLPGAVYQRVMYPDGTITFPYVSRGVIETHGVDAEMVKRHGSILVRAIHPDDRERFGRTLRESAQTLTPFDMEIRNVKPDGQVVWVRTVARPHRREDGATVWDGLFVDVTARKEAEERAAQSYRWLKEAIESLSDGFVLWDGNDRLVLWNDRYLDGHPQRAELVREGTTFSQLIDATADNLRRTMTREEVAAWRKDRMFHHREAHGTYEMQTSTGRWLMITERRTQEGYTVGIYTDITNRKRRADQLVQSEERYRRLVQLSPDAIFVHIAGEIVFANDTSAKMMGAENAADLVGMDILQFAHPEDRLTIISRREGLTDTDLPGMIETRYLRLNGEVRHCESSISKIRWQDSDAYLVVIRDIEERVEAQRQQAIMTAVFDQAVDAIEIVGDDLSFVYANPAFERMTGYSMDEVQGLRPRDVLAPHQGETAPYGEIEATLRAGKPWTGTMPARRKDGSEFMRETTISPVFDEHGTIKNFVAIERDITDRLRTEQALRDSEDRYRKLLSLTPDAIYVHVGSQIVLANEAAVEVFGATDEADLVGRSVFDLMGEEVRLAAAEYMEQVFDGTVETLRFEQRRLRIDGTEFWASAAITPLNWEGERGALVILRDISEQRRAREELIRAMETAEVANRSKSEFLANMSHELRTPLNAIIGFSEIMQNEMFGPLGSANYADYVRDIHGSGMHLLHVINDILDLSKIEAGKIVLKKTDIDLVEIAATCVRFISNAAETAGVRIEIRLPPGLPAFRADERMLKQMLMNLLSNAIKFTPEGKRIRISAAPEGDDRIRIAVTDTGIGIPEEDLPRVLEPFVQVSTPVQKRAEGTGLGLPLTKSLVELHGGTLQMWSRPGRGTRAVIRLPISGGE